MHDCAKVLHSWVKKLNLTATSPQFKFPGSITSTCNCVFLPLHRGGCIHVGMHTNISTRVCSYTYVCAQL